MTENRFYCARFYVTYRCNSRCVYCNVWKRTEFQAVDELSSDDAKKLLRQCYEQGVRYVDFTGGEPTLYPHLAEIIDYAKKLGMKTEVTSNCIAAFSKQKMLEVAATADKFNTSLDTLDDEAYHRIRGVDCCEKVKSAVADIAAVRSPKIMTVVTKDNIDELEKLIAYAQKHRAMIYLSPMFPYVDKDGSYKISQYMPDIISCIFKPYTVVLLHFMEFFKNSSPDQLPPCSANRQTLTLAPNGNVVLPCYHAVVEQIPWNGDLRTALTSETFKKYMRNSGVLPLCRGCCVIPYFGILFSYQLNKYFLLQSFSEKLSHLKRDGLNALLDGFDLNLDFLNRQLAEMMEMAESLSYKPDTEAWRQNRPALYPVRQTDKGIISPVYRLPLEAELFENEQKAEDCWHLTMVPHYYFDRFCQNVIRPLLQGKVDSPQKVGILRQVIEFQIRWWKFYMNRYFKLDKAFDTLSDEEWLVNYLDFVNETTNGAYRSLIEEGRAFLEISAAA